MDRKCFTTFLILLIFLPGLAQSEKVAPPDTLKVVAGSSYIPYLREAPGGKTVEVHSIELKIAYWGIGTKDTSVNFELSNFSATKLDVKNVTVNPNLTVKKGSFRKTPDTVSVTLHISISPLTWLPAPEFFDIGIAGDNNNSTRHRVVLEKELREKEKEPKEKETRVKGITLLNAAHFDFEKNSNTSYVGILNAFAPDLIKLFWKKVSVGVNTGLMKVNYSKSGDSVNSTLYVRENVLFSPFDTVKQGTKYLAQFNKYLNVAKNTTFSFYAQPLVRLSRATNKKAEIFAHGHFDFFVSKWTINTTISNIRQDTLTISASEAPADFRLVNKFSTISDPVMYTSVQSLMSYYYGFGATFRLQPWAGTEIFMQPTFGNFIEYGRSVAETILLTKSSTAKETAETRRFYLTRAHLKQKLSSSIELVIGTEFRGIWPRTGQVAEKPLFANYIGITLKLEALKELLR